jgi:ribonucleoside-triphosphate reductase
MSIKALQDYTFNSKYARYDNATKRREVWQEAVERVQQMHLDRFPQVEEEIRWAFTQVRAKRVLGSQRALQYGGRPILRNNARMYNCVVSYCDRVRFFQEALWLLLSGCGVGFSVQKHHIAKLPTFLPCRPNKQSLPKKIFTIPDSIEGWADALGVLLASYFSSDGLLDWAGTEVEFDYCLIRPKGSYLSSGVGKAPGPEPLRKSLENIRKLLERCLTNGQTGLRTIDAYDLVMHASDAVLSGGVRRSATICVFSPDDELMLAAKTGSWSYTDPQRGRSNNSVLLLRSDTTREQFHAFMDSVKQFGEPGFVWSDSTEMLFNPCVEIGMYPVDITTGESGWAFCNLCEINGGKCRTKEDFAIAARAGAIIGTLQAAYTDFPYLGEATKRIVDREALLGVSITGMMENHEVLFNPETQREMAKLVVSVNEEIAKKIGINPSARSTCVKPSGNSACLLGTSSGVHFHHAKRYIRRVQANELEAPYLYFKKHNPRAVEKSFWSANGTDSIISFCIETRDSARTKDGENACTQLEHVCLTQQNWVEAGKVPERCTAPWLRHNVSNTINVRSDEWDAVEEFIYKNREHLAGVSMLSDSGDLDYRQAPFLAIHTPTEIARTYGDGSLMASGLIVDGLHAFPDDLWKACDAAMGTIPESEQFTPEQIDWIRRAKQFAERYFGGDIRRMTYCLKEVNNWKLWCDLRRETVAVDYTQMVEDEDTTTIEETAACAGGLCEFSGLVPPSLLGESQKTHSVSA